MRGRTGIAAACVAIWASASLPAPGATDAIPAPAVSQALHAAARLHGLPAPTMPAIGRGYDLRAALTAWHEAFGRGADRDRVEPDVRALSRLPRAHRDAVAVLAGALADAAQHRAAALAAVSAPEVAFAWRVALGAQFAPETVSRDEALAALSVVRRIDVAAMLRGAAVVSAAAAAVRTSLAGVEGPADGVCAAGGSICVGSAGDDTYTDDVQLLIEPAGDDTYLNNAGGHLSAQTATASGGCVLGGGTTGRGRPNLACSPLPGNVCTYDTLNRATGRDDLPVVGIPNHEEPGSGGLNEGSCGSDDRRDNFVAATEGIAGDHDSRGVSLLLDLDGADTYTVPWSHDDPLFGLIEDCYPGEADKVNTNRDLFQGGSLAGISVLWDAGAGDDEFRGRLNAQGSGHVGGVGMLVAEGRGDDAFWADRLSQGNGIAGGIGLLVNTKTGNHTYLLDAPLVYRNEFRPNGRDCAQEGRAGQGQGGFAGVGILWSSHEGSAVYRAVTQVTKKAHPFAPVLGSDGKPLLLAGTDAQGSGESFPIPDTPGGLVVGAGLLLHDTGGDGIVCAPDAQGRASAGMLAASTTSTGTDLSTRGTHASCGTFNLPPEITAGDLAGAIEHASAGAVGLRVVT